MQRCFFTTLLPLSLIYSNTHKAAADMHIMYDANNDTLIVAEYCDKLAQHDTINADTMSPLCDVITSLCIAAEKQCVAPDNVGVPP